MVDVRVAELAAQQHNRFSRSQLATLGIGPDEIRHRLDAGRWVAVHEAVFAIAPVLDDERGRWMAATLTEAGSVLSHASAGAAWGWWDRPREFEIVTRPGSGGPRRLDGVLVHRSLTLGDDVAEVHGIRATAVPRTLLDLTPHVGSRLLARCVREAIRLRTTSAADVIDALAGRHRGRRGSRRLALTVARYTGLPVERARSGAEVVALELLRDAGRPMPELNRRVAGEEADLSWSSLRLIIEIDGGPFHLDAGEDARKTATWERAGWTVKRVPSDLVYKRPEQLLAIAPNVHECPS
jgi:Protein of unknown function (DUF559)